VAVAVAVAVTMTVAVETSVAASGVTAVATTMATTMSAPPAPAGRATTGRAYARSRAASAGGVSRAAAAAGLADFRGAFTWPAFLRVARGYARHQRDDRDGHHRASNARSAVAGSTSGR
jgi:hypothetical protein